MKTELFQQLDDVMLDSEAILASNTSSIPIMKLGIATRRPDLVVGVHFFNPVPVLKLVEIVPSLLTSEETIDDVANFAEKTLGKRTIRCQDRAGLRGQRAAHPVPALGDPHVRVRASRRPTTSTPA